jgi:hypothetical protein
MVAPSLGSSSDAPNPSPLGLIVTSSGVDSSLLGTVNQTLDGVSSWKHHP